MLKGTVEMPVYSVVPRNSLNKELIFLASGAAWLVMAGARKLVAARHEARLNAWAGPAIVPVGISTHPSFRDAPLGAGPESIIPIVVMDSGLVASLRPGMTKLQEASLP